MYLSATYLTKALAQHPNFVFKLWPGDYRVMASFPVRLFLTWFNWRTGHKFQCFCVIYLA
jgi:hypothetical protein